MLSQWRKQGFSFTNPKQTNKKQTNKQKPPPSPAEPIKTACCCAHSNANVPTQTRFIRTRTSPPNRTADDPTKNKRESSRRGRPFSPEQTGRLFCVWGGGAWVSIRLAAKLPHKQGWSSNGRTGHAAANNGAGLTGFWAVENGDSRGSCPATALRM